MPAILRTLSDHDRYEIARLRQEVRGLDFESARLLHLYRSGRPLSLYESELRFCESLEAHIAQAKAERAIPLRTSGNGYDPRPPSVQATYAAPIAEPPPPPMLIDASGWHDLPVPARQWAVQDRVPRGNVTPLNGAGAIGKSTLLLQLAVAHVTARDWRCH